MSVPLSLFCGALSAFLSFRTTAYSAVSGGDTTCDSDSGSPPSTSPSGSGGAGVLAGTAGGAGVSVCPALLLPLQFTLLISDGSDLLMDRSLDCLSIPMSMRRCFPASLGALCVFPFLWQPTHRTTMRMVTTKAEAAAMTPSSRTLP